MGGKSSTAYLLTDIFLNKTSTAYDLYVNLRLQQHCASAQVSAFSTAVNTNPSIFQKRKHRSFEDFKIHHHISLLLGYKRKNKSKNILRTGSLILSFWFLNQTYKVLARYS